MTRLVGGELVQVELDEDSSSSINVLEFRCSVELVAGSVGGASGRKRVALSSGESPLSTHIAVGSYLELILLRTVIWLDLNHGKILVQWNGS